MRVRVGGEWKEVERAVVRVGGAWQRLTEVRAREADAWEVVANFVPALSLTALPTFVSGTRFGAGVAITNTVTVTPEGGSGPFTYLWALLEGDSAVSNSPTSASTNFSRTMEEDEDASGVFRCTATDSLGTVATVDVFFSFESSTFN